MRERPILFSAPMVRAILEGRKTQTRRVVKLPHENPLGTWEPTTFAGADARGGEHEEQAAIWHTRTGDTLVCPHGQPGDRLWVRETWQQVHPLQVADGRYAQKGWAGIPGPPPVDYQVVYRADGEFPPIYSLGGEPWPYRSLEPFEREGMKAFVDEPSWIPSIHMPRWACRLELEITGVRVERLQAVSDADAIAEGTPGGHGSIPGYGYNALPSEHFMHLWESINGTGSWAANPWVWVIEFQRVKS